MNKQPLKSCAPMRTRGFTLVEMTVVIVIMALILGSILVPLSTQYEQRQVIDTRRQLEEIKEALIVYAIAQPAAALPCPDKTVSAGAGTPNDGLEDVEPGGTCVRPEGNVPWETLGLAASDAWGNRYRYRVTPEFAQRAPAAKFTLDTFGIVGNALRVCTAASCGSAELLTVDPPSPNAIAAIILSHGPNGWGAISAGTGRLNLPPGCGAVVGCLAIKDIEQSNADQNTSFVSRAPSASGSDVGAFDDIVVWLSPHTLKHRMVAAGKLP